MILYLYCERHEPGLWAEPVNTVTNLVFFLAAWAAWRLARRLGIRAGRLTMLLVLLIAIGSGSALFHAFATPETRLLDVLPILLFQLVYLGLYARTVIGLHRRHTGMVVGGFFVVALLGRQLPPALNGSLIYAPAVLLLCVLGIYHRIQQKREASVMLIATGVFVLALACRSLDWVLCPYVPMGTHFLWHLLNGGMLYLAMRGLLQNWPTTEAAVIS